MPFSQAKNAGFNIPLAFACSQKDISSAAAFQHTLCNSVMFVFIAVFFQVWAMFVPFKMCPHLVANIGKVRIDGKIVFSIVIHNGTDAFGLSFNRVHHAQFINYPGERWFPIAAFINTLQCLVGGHRVAKFFAAYAGNWVAEQCITPIYLHGY